MILYLTTIFDEDDTRNDLLVDIDLLNKPI